MSDQVSEEQRQLVDYVLSLRADRVRGLLSLHDIPTSGPKRVLRERLLTAIANEGISPHDIASYLDEVEPWGSQHVYLYDVSDEVSKSWRDGERVLKEMAEAGVAELVTEPLTLTLPDEMTLAAINLGPESIEIRAVDARRYTERLPNFDREAEVDGLAVEFRAYAQRLSRGLLTLRWDLAESQASLHISKAHRGYEYEKAEEDFAKLVADWLPFEASFQRLDLRKAVKKLAKRERDGATPLTRSARVGLQSAGGREIDISSANVHTSTAGEKPIDEAVEAIANVSRGRLGNLYWLSQSDCTVSGNPLEEELHTMILAVDSRIHFMTPSSGEAIAYVLQSVRSLC